MPPTDRRLLVRGTRYSAIPVMSLEGIQDVYLAEGTVNGERFEDFIMRTLLPILQPFNWINPHSVVIMDIDHMEGVTNLIENQAGAQLNFLLPDLDPLEKVFSQVQCIISKMIHFFKFLVHQGPWHFGM